MQSIFLESKILDRCNEFFLQNHYSYHDNFSSVLVELNFKLARSEFPTILVLGNSDNFIKLRPQYFFKV